MKYTIFILELLAALSLFLNPKGAIKKPDSYWTIKRIRIFQIVGLVLSIQSIVALVVMLFI